MFERDYNNPIKVDRDPEEDWSTGGHRSMDHDYEAEPALVKATRVWAGIRDVVARRA